MKILNENRIKNEELTSFYTEIIQLFEFTEILEYCQQITRDQTRYNL